MSTGCVLGAGQKNIFLYHLNRIQSEGPLLDLVFKPIKAISKDNWEHVSMHMHEKGIFHRTDSYAQVIDWGDDPLY